MRVLGALAWARNGFDKCKRYLKLTNVSVIAGLGYSSTDANLLSVPPYTLAAVMTVIVGYVADRTQQRGICNLVVSFSYFSSSAALH